MSRQRHGLLTAAAVGVGISALLPCGRGATIGISVGSDRQAMTAGEVAGVVPQANWNQAPQAGSTTDITGPSAGAVVDSGGSAVAGVTVSWYGDKGNRTWSAGSSFVNVGDQDMMGGYLDSGYNGYDANNEYIAVDGLPAAYTAGGYEVYVYVRGAGVAQLNASSESSTPIFYYSGINNPSSYVQATSTTAASPAAADYVLFSGQTASSFKVSDWKAGLAGVQIVPMTAVPEPASLVTLAGLAGAAMLLRRQRRDC